MPKIRIMNGPMRGREKTVSVLALTIGRDAEAGLQILDRSASRFHAEVFPVGGMWFVRDLDSKNGTHVNDDRLEDEELLRVGDVIKIGTTEIAFEAGNSIGDEDSSGKVAYSDDPEVLSNTLEFRLDELSDISEPAESGPDKDNAKGLRILYQIGRIISEPGHMADREARVLDCLIASLPAEAGLIFRRDAVSGKLSPSVVRTSRPEVQPVISRSIIKKTFTENKALHSANAQEDERFSKHASVSIKGIRSVVCVPLPVGGQLKGVVYLSRGHTSGGMPLPPFDQFDLELVSACSLQLGLAQTAEEQRMRHRTTLWHTLVAMVRGLETRAQRSGSGERCARTCTVLATAMNLDVNSRERLRVAGLLHHVPELADGTTLNHLEPVEDLSEVLPLVRQCHERLDGSGPLGIGADDLDTEGRILALAGALESRTAVDPISDAQPIIEGLAEDPGFDRQIARLLLGCHLDGSLYQ